MRTVLLLIMLGTFLFSVPAMAEPIGATEETEMSVKEAQKYLKDNGITIPEDVREICENVSAETEILAEILEAMAWVETRCTEKITSKDGKCVGIVQVNPNVHMSRMKRLGVTDLYNAEGCIRVGADYLSELTKKYSLEKALNAYNGDTTGNDYGKRIIQISKALEIAYWD